MQACKDGVDATGSQLSEDLKNDLKDICDEAADGDDEDLREATVEICVKIVEETVPEGSARDQAVDACEAAAGQ